MSRSDSKLQTLVRLLSHREAQAKRQLAARRQAMEGAESKAEELSGMQQEYQDRLNQASGKGVQSGDLRMWRRFNQQLDDVVAVQAMQVERLREELEQAQSACLAALVKRRGGERLEEAQQRHAATRAKRRERVEASDQANRRGDNG